jgi:hypothetical protein
VESLHDQACASALGGRRRGRPVYQDPVEFISKHQGRAAGPGGAGTPSAQLVDPSQATARAAGAGFAGDPGALLRQADHRMYAQKRRQAADEDDARRSWTPQK